MYGHANRCDGFKDGAFDIVIIDFDAVLILILILLSCRRNFFIGGIAFLFLLLAPLVLLSLTPLLARLLVDFATGAASLAKPCSADSFLLLAARCSTKASCTSSILMIFSLERKTSQATQSLFCIMATDYELIATTENTQIQSRRNLT